MNLTDDIKISIDIIDDNLDVETKFSQIINFDYKLYTMFYLSCVLTKYLTIYTALSLSS